MIASNHHRTDAGAPCASDGLLRFVAWRIDHADQAGEHEVPFDVFADAALRQRPVHRRAKRDGQRAQGAPRQRIVRAQNLSAPRSDSARALRRPVRACIAPAARQAHLS